MFCPKILKHILPIIVDVDIKKEVKDSSEIKCLYTENEVISLIDIYQEQIQKFFVNINENNLVCFFLKNLPELMKKNIINS